MFGYFDLARDLRAQLRPAGIGTGTGTGTAAAAGGGSGTVGQQLLQYLGLTAGIVVQPWLAGFAAQGIAVADVPALLARVPVGLVMALVLFPGVYRGAFDPAKPFLVQCGALLVAGIGWQSAFSSAVGAVHG